MQASRHLHPDYGTHATFPLPFEHPLSEPLLVNPSLTYLPALLTDIFGCRGLAPSTVILLRSMKLPRFLPLSPMPFPEPTERLVQASRPLRPVYGTYATFLACCAFAA